MTAASRVMDGLAVMGAACRGIAAWRPGGAVSAELQRSRDLLRLSLELGGVSTFRLDLRRRMIAFGTGDGGGEISLERWLGRLLREDRRRCVMMLRGGARERRAELEFEFRCHGGRVVAGRARVEWVEVGGRVPGRRARSVSGVVVDVTERRAAERRAEHMLQHDLLTNLPNRRLFHARLASALEAASSGVSSAVHLLNLDRFKEVNETLGHPGGDRLLCLVTGRLRALCRGTDTVARLDGDEFAIIQSPVARQEDAEAMARRIIECLATPFDLDGRVTTLGASLGIAPAVGSGLDGERLLGRAELALREAKRAGRGRSVTFSAALEAEVRDRKVLDQELRGAVAAGEMEVFYQPLVGIAANRVCGMEALVRWRHPVRGLVAPDHFIPQAEANGSITAIGDFVLRRACADAMAWPREVTVAVNLSAREFGNPGLVESVAAALHESGLNPSRLQLEITESTILADTEATAEALFRLKAMGVSLSIDDFGTGFSSLSYLQRFPFDKVKIDRSFIAPLAESAERSAESMVIVRSVVGLCSGLNIETTAEGVETAGQLAILSGIGCTEAQGYHFSRPRPGHEIAGFLREFGHGFGREVGPVRVA